MDIHVNIGSNIGNRHRLIARAVSDTARAFCLEPPGICLEGHLPALPLTLGEGVPGIAVSAPWESAPWGYRSARPYINCGVMLRIARCTLQPGEVLERLLQVQRAIDPSPHRDASGQYTDRAIDIDLIAVDCLTASLGDILQLPHPRMHLRPFVLEPMAQLAPGWIHPLIGLTPAQMLSRL